MAKTRLSLIGVGAEPNGEFEAKGGVFVETRNRISRLSLCGFGARSYAGFVAKGEPVEEDVTNGSSAVARAAEWANLISYTEYTKKKPDPLQQQVIDEDEIILDMIINFVVNQ